jgi:Tfp pilus assembly protein PilX
MIDDERRRAADKEIRESERGTILVTVLILLMIVSLMGIMATNIATVDLQITGNTKRTTAALEGAEGGSAVATSVIENTMENKALTPGATTAVITSLDTANLDEEIRGGVAYDMDDPQASPDLAMADLGQVAVNVDIDWMYTDLVAGGAAAMAMGYDGVGGGAGGGGSGALYQIRSQGTR